MSNKILIGCTVKEKNLEYANLETDYLFRTLNEFGGKLSNTKKIAVFTENPERLLKNSLDNQEVEIRVVKSLNKNYQYETYISTNYRKQMMLKQIPNDQKNSYPILTTKHPIDCLIANSIDRKKLTPKSLEVIYR